MSFYKDLMTFLGWQVIFEKTDVIGFKSGTNGDLWFVKTPQDEFNDYDNLGVNHLSIRVENQKDVDDVVSFLQKHHISTLFHTPKHRPEFTGNDSETYYQIMFESPDRVLFEIVYIGLKR